MKVEEAEKVCKHSGELSESNNGQCQTLAAKGHGGIQLNIISCSKSEKLQHIEK